MKTPQLILIVMYAFQMGIVVSWHGKPKTGEYNAGYLAIDIAISQAILWWGGWYL